MLAGAVALQASGCLGSVIVTCITWYRAGEIVLVGRRARTKTSLASLMVQSGASFVWNIQPRSALNNTF